MTNVRLVSDDKGAVSIRQQIIDEMTGSAIGVAKEVKVKEEDRTQETIDAIEPAAWSELVRQAFRTMKKVGRAM